eukprot:m.64238 g.64238  ORF g.64238 m.64238 type:complete len:217 (-) comp11993_c0_seq2:253-903(-)
MSLSQLSYTRYLTMPLFDMRTCPCPALFLVSCMVHSLVSNHAFFFHFSLVWQQILGWFTCRSASTSAPSINEIWFHAALGNKFSSSDMIGCITNYSVRDHRGHVGMDCTVYTRPEGSRVLVPVPFNVTSHVIGETVHHVTSQDQETGESDLGTIDTSDTHRTLDSRLPPIMFPEALAQAARETEAHGDAVLGAIKQLLLEIQEEEAHIHQCLKPAA